MIRIMARAQHLVVMKGAALTSGSVGERCEFIFDSAWDGLTKAAVFTAGDECHTVLLTGDSCEVPWECLQTAFIPLTVAIYGHRGTRRVLASDYAELQITEGAEPEDDETTDPSLAVWAQLQESVDNVEDALAEEARARAEADEAIGELIEGKQDSISDLSTIRAGAAAGATAIQTETDPTVHSWAKAAQKPTYTAAEVGALAVGYHDDTKQDVISDLATIRSGAAAGGTALQPVTGKSLWSSDEIAAVVAENVPTDDITANTNARHTHSNKEALDYITMLQLVKWNAKQDKMIAGSGITIAEDGKTISSTGGGGGGSTAWADITGKPSTFPPSAHEHTVSEITDFPSIPTDNVELANGAGYVTSEYHDESKQDTLTLGRNMSYDSDGKLTSRSARLALYNGTSIIISGSTPATFDEVWNAVMHEDGINASPKTNLYLRHSSYGDVYWLSSFGHVSGTRVLSWTAVNTNGVYTVLFKATGELTETEYSPHAHDNKTVLDGITAAKVAAWDACVADYTAALGVI